MFSQIVLFCLASLSIVNGQIPTRESTWPHDLLSPFPYKTLSPVNIDTSETVLVKTPTNLTLTVGVMEPHVVTNTGHLVRVTVNKPGTTFVTGGALGNDKYVFQELVYLWNGDYRSSAGALIDGIGSAVVARAVFRNEKYHTVAEANSHRNGYAILKFNIIVEGYVPNKKFAPFEEVLRKIRRSGSSTIVTSLPLFIWFDPISLIHHYFAYPGAYVPSEGNTQSPTEFDSATVIQFPRCRAPFISIPQFKNFLHLMNPSGTPITFISAPHKRLGRPVVEIDGVEQHLIPAAV